ncbi:hypothetical protein POTOM_054939 [Populus tomentosa]|uniref:non-specific serine/threonine protein kinase n=1 Tax=Populus tomentosa TaxID=118781 RepID=A0A8X7Y3C9_POPTO|nr:hypothetical protein POTOM_054939 [Populus tomentosa]
MLKRVDFDIHLTVANGFGVIVPLLRYSMESLVNGVDSSSKTLNPASRVGSHPNSTSEMSCPSRPPVLRQSRNEGDSFSAFYASSHCLGMHTIHHSMGQSELVSSPDVVCKSAEISLENNISVVENISRIKHPMDDPKSSNSSGSLECESVVSGPSEASHSALSFTSIVEKSVESGKVSNSCDNESRKMSLYRGSTDSDVSDESRALGFSHFKLVKRLGGGDIGSVYLSELSGTRTCFAMKVMDKAALAARKKLLRAQTEQEILQSLDHPFLPTLYTHFETEKFSGLLMEFCPGGDLHALRQRQPGKYFPEHAARSSPCFGMLGIIYRDLKPENVLVREDGHIMLSDFDLSPRCAVCPTLVKSSNPSSESKNSSYCVQPACIEPTCVMQPDCIQPPCFVPRFLSAKAKKGKKSKPGNEMNHHQVCLLPELIAEPTNARSMSFVGTHEYLGPEIIKGEGHGSAVDWWAFGIFLYELLFGKTPFKGTGNRATLYTVVGQPLRFPESPTVSSAARELIGEHQVGTHSLYKPSGGAKGSNNGISQES